MRTAVVGHVEWVTFASVDELPRPGEITHAHDSFDLPAGGGPVAAVQLLRLAGDCTFFTALGDDELGHRAFEELTAFGLDVRAVFRPVAQRRAFTHVRSDGERTITVMGSRLGPQADEDLGWDDLDGVDAAFFCAGDEAALRRARAARVLVSTSREGDLLAQAGVALDAVVGSGNDPSEKHRPIEPPPSLVVTTNGASGGSFEASGEAGTFGPGRLDGSVVCAYGAGDSFVAALTYALAAGRSTEDALAFAADHGAACLTGRGPYEGQLGGAAVPPRRGSA